MLVLGIETSCDETATAIVRSDRSVLAEKVYSQLDEHRAFGGVVPEIAARAHLDRLDGLIEAALAEAKIDLQDLDAIAATAGPGLIGGLAIGLATAKSLCVITGLPLAAVNHLEGHALTARLTNNTDFPYMLFLASGGHCQILICHGVGQYQRLGTTLDDALGEAYDKTAKMMGLGYPGGPPVESYARTGDPQRFNLPRPLMGKPGCHFSFSGLKAAVRRQLLQLAEEQTVTRDDAADMCASFEASVQDIVRDRLTNALQNEAAAGITALVIAGGVAANKTLRATCQDLALEKGIELVAPPMRLCTDNATMIAWAGIERLAHFPPDLLNFGPRARWPLDPDAEPALGAGIKA